MAQHAQRFWQEREDYHALAEEYERNIEITHPDYVTSDRLFPYAVGSSWCATAVTYYEYQGDSLK